MAAFPEKPSGARALWVRTALAEKALLEQIEFGVIVVTGIPEGLNSSRSCELTTVGPVPEGGSHQKLISALLTSESCILSADT